MKDVFLKYQNSVDRTPLIKTYGKLEGVNGLLLEGCGPTGSIGHLCFVQSSVSDLVGAEIVGFKNGKTLLMPLDHLHGVSLGMQIQNTCMPIQVSVGSELMGRVVSGIGLPIDGLGSIQTNKKIDIDNQPPDSYTRLRISESICTGVKVIDGLLTVGKGQRLGIFAGSGVGKSSLLGMIARNTNADVNVIALIGERGREVREFLEEDLGEEGLKRSVVVVVTGDESPLLRIRGAYVATAIAEFFRDQGSDVMFMMDSVTRFAMAQREVGLSLGEPPAMRGYTPSVFSSLQKLLERTGTGARGTITAFYTVLVEGDDENEPIADTVRGILDGHIILSRDLADKNHFPAVDVLSSISRVMKDVTSESQRELSGKLREILAIYKESEDLINIGAYVKGTNPKIEEAISKISTITQFLRQEIHEISSFSDTLSMLENIFS